MICQRLIMIVTCYDCFNQWFKTKRAELVDLATATSYCALYWQFFSGCDLACQQKVSLALINTLPIHYYNVVDSAFSNYAGVVAYLTRVNTTYRVTHLYANGIYARDECHAMDLVFWIETFIFIRVLLFKWNQWNDVIIFLTNKSRR